MKEFYKVYYTTNASDDIEKEFVLYGENHKEEFETLDDAVKVMESDKKRIDDLNKKINSEEKIKHNYKIYSYTRKLEMFWNNED